MTPLALPALPRRRYRIPYHRSRHPTLVRRSHRHPILALRCHRPRPARPGRRNRLARSEGAMRTMFLIYTVGIFAGLTYFIVIGLTHR